MQTHIVPADGPDWIKYEACVGVECLTCGAEEVGVKAHASGFDYCRNCFHTGRAYEDTRRAHLEELKAELPGWEVGIEHTGGGCFWLAFYPPNGNGYFYTATDGEASLPTVDGQPIRDGWGYLARNFYSNDREADPSVSEDHPDYEGTIVAEAFAPADPDHDRYWNEYPKHCLSDAEIVAAMLADWEKVRA